MIERELASIFASLPDTEVTRAAAYATLGGGHRWRGLLAIASAEVFGEGKHRDAALRAGCAMEMVHAASIILDDLPSMDDGRIRRGRPCVHLVYPLWAVDLAPSYLVSLGFRTLLTLPGVEPGRRNRYAAKAADTAIAMCFGQESDLRAGRSTGPDWIEDLTGVNREKTGTLYGLAASCGACLSGQPEDLSCEFGMLVGIAYQLLDDLADDTESAEALGKTANQDLGKPTVSRLLGPEKCEALLRGILRKAGEVLDQMKEEVAPLRPFAEGLMEVRVTVK